MGYITCADPRTARLQWSQCYRTRRPQECAPVERHFKDRKAIHPWRFGWSTYPVDGCQTVSNFLLNRPRLPGGGGAQWGARHWSRQARAWASVVVFGAKDTTHEPQVRPRTALQWREVACWTLVKVPELAWVQALSRWWEHVLGIRQLVSSEMVVARWRWQMRDRSPSGMGVSVARSCAVSFLAQCPVTKRGVMCSHLMHLDSQNGHARLRDAQCATTQRSQEHITFSRGHFGSRDSTLSRAKQWRDSCSCSFFNGTRAWQSLVTLVALGDSDSDRDTLHLYIFISVHLYSFTSLHLYIFTSLHLYIFTSLHLYIFTAWHLYIV